MWVIVHTYVGLALASLLHLPFWQMMLVVLASHVLLDLVPHWDYTADRERLLWASVDVLAALATVIALLVWGMPLAVVAHGARSPPLPTSTSWAVPCGDARAATSSPATGGASPTAAADRPWASPLQLAIVAACAGVVLSVGV